MSSKKIFVTGGNGQLGSELKELASSYPQYQFLFFDREQLPVNDKALIELKFKEHQPDYFINCAAYTAVDKAESEKDLANEINGTAVGNIASVCKAFDTKLIHISTDYVFHGDQSTPWKETDETQPVNAYGASKLLGEQLALQNNPSAIVIRTSWVYSSFGKNFVKTMIRLMNERNNIGVVSDQCGSPTYAADLAEAILQIISSGKWTPGIYNFSNEGVITWFEFANEIKQMIQSDCVINPLSTEQYPTPAKRPRYSVLDKTKIKETFSIQLKDWKVSLKTCIDKLEAAN